MTTITISPQTYQRLAEQAQQTARSVDGLVESLLNEELQPSNYPYIEQKPSHRGGKPIIRGTNMPGKYSVNSPEGVSETRFL
ncbi:hypothetical protein QUF63_17435 [Anaerolineales bacterium HSG25]|nr:hypothetical protein [Anaerolineales bacterium HSG25]